jgi:hypothetical protein
VNKNIIIKNMKNKIYKIEVDNSEEEMFPRSELHYELSEVLFIMSRISNSIPLSFIADFVQRSPRALTFKFLTYRPVNPDGSLNVNESVATEAEALTYTKKSSMYSLDIDMSDMKEETEAEEQAAMLNISTQFEKIDIRALAERLTSNLGEEEDLDNAV